MHDIIAFLKGAISRVPNAGIFGCYVVHDGNIYAHNGHLQAAVAMSTEQSFNVPAIELEEVLARMPSVTALEYNGQALLIRGGRLRATIQCFDGEPPEVPQLPTEWKQCPMGLLPALKLAAQFVGDQGWNAGIRLKGNKVTAIRNVAGIDIKIDDLNFDEVLITSITIEFFTNIEPPEQYAQTPGAVFFRWADGRWMRTQLLNATMPPNVDQIFAKAGTEAPIEIIQEWREAFADAAALSGDGAMVFDQTGLHSAKGAARSDVEIVSTGLPDGFSSRWIAKVLEPIITNATHWNPGAYPAPALFVGPGIRGVVVGQR